MVGSTFDRTHSVSCARALRVESRRDGLVFEAADAEIQGLTFTVGAHGRSYGLVLRCSGADVQRVTIPHAIWTEIVFSTRSQGRRCSSSLGGRCSASLGGRCSSSLGGRCSRRMDRSMGIEVKQSTASTIRINAGKQIGIDITAAVVGRCSGGLGGRIVRAAAAAAAAANANIAK